MLPLSLALSQLHKSDFAPYYEEIYDTGLKLVEQQLEALVNQPPVAPRTPTPTFIASVLENHEPAIIQISQIDEKHVCEVNSTNDSNVRIWYPPQLSLRDYCMFRIDMVEVDLNTKIEMLEIFDKSKCSNNDGQGYNKGTEKDSVKITYGGRNILNLNQNINGTWNFTPSKQIPASLAKSKTAGRKIHPTSPCSSAGCSFKQPFTLRD